MSLHSPSRAAQAPKRPLPSTIGHPLPTTPQPSSQAPGAPATEAAAVNAPKAPAGVQPLAELLTSAPRQHALRLNPPTPPQADPTTAPQARHAHD